MKHEHRNENTSRKEWNMPGVHHPRWDRRVIRSLGDDERVDPDERMVAVSQRENTLCERSHINDESEWSLMTLLIRRLGFPCEQSAGRSEVRETSVHCEHCDRELSWHASLIFLAQKVQGEGTTQGSQSYRKKGTPPRLTSTAL